MRRNIHQLILSGIMIFGSVYAFAQPESFSYAVTGQAKDGAGWTELRKIDLKNGSFSDIILDGISPKRSVLDYKGRPLNNAQVQVNNIDPRLPFVNGVAAIGYDKKNNRLFFIPMYYDQLRYIDLTNMEVHSAGNGFGKPGAAVVETMTRMVIAADGYGYALSTNADHLYKFNTGGLPEINDLGSLKDAPSNGAYSVLNNPCMNAGGDLIADDEGSLYLITARNSVYKISPADLTAKHMGEIKGLPKDYTSNGAAVDHEGKIILSTSLVGGGLYRADLATMKAEAYHAGATVFTSSDLASSNLLKTAKARVTVPVATNKGFVKIFPNPVRSTSVNLRFSNMETGAYIILVTDVTGRQVFQQKINAGTANFTENIPIPSGTSKGMYMMRVVNNRNVTVMTDKLFIERTR